MNFFPFRRSRRPAARPDRRPAPAGTAARAQLQVEALEDRSVPSCNVISGYVYHDANNNGLYDIGAETPIANSPIELRNDANVVVATAVADANGYYEFETDSTIDTTPKDLTYTAEFPSTMTNFDLQRTVKQFDPSLGQLLSVKIVHTGNITTDLRAENTSDVSSTVITGNISGTIHLTGPNIDLINAPSRNAGTFRADVFDGDLDFGGPSGRSFGAKTASSTRSAELTGADMEPFVGTGDVTLREQALATSNASGGGNLVVAVNSRASGTVQVIYRYIPSNCLRGGNYTIIQTQQPPGYLDSQESRNGTVLNNPEGTSVIPVTLVDRDLPHNDFGELLPASLSGYVYVDTSPGGLDNGIREPGEASIPGTTITLTGTDNLGAVNQTTTTDGNGYYQFLNLRPGNYTLTETQPSNYLDGRDTIGSQGGQAGNDVLTAIALGAGVHGVENNFGELTPVVSPPPPPPGAPPQTDLAIVKAASASVVPVGSPVTYTLTISNLGPDNAVGVTVRDTLPAGVQFLSASGDGWAVSQAQGIITATRDGLAVGATSVIAVGITAPNSPGTIDNVSTVESNTPDTNPNNNRSTVSVHVVAPQPPGPIANAQEVFAPQPANLPPTISVLSKSSLISDSGVSNIDPALRTQITWVETLYRTLLGRESDPAGLIYWVRQVRAGMSHQDIVQTFWTSDAHRAMQVQSLYRNLLGRDAPADGIAYWTGVFQSGATETDVATGIVLSSEFSGRHTDPAGFVDALYRSVLGRPADTGAQEFWQPILASQGREVMTRALLNSDEARGRMLDTASGMYLGHSLGDGERQWWLEQLRGGMPAAQVPVLMLSSDEMWNRAVQANG